MPSSGTTSTGLFVSIQPAEGLSSQVLDALLIRVRRRIDELSIDLANTTGFHSPMRQVFQPTPLRTMRLTIVYSLGHLHTVSRPEHDTLQWLVPYKIYKLLAL
jgi:hypothetical protein